MSQGDTTRGLPVLETEPARRGPDRRVDRRITYLGLATAIGFLVAAMASMALPAAARLGAWLPLHLVLAGAVGTAVAAMLPFFVAALSVAPPAPAGLRAAGVILVAGGAVAGVLGRVVSSGGASALAAAGAAGYVAGMGAVGLCAVLALRRAAGPRRPATELAYAVALLDVMVGVALVGLFLAGDAGVAGRWAGLRVGHAWLNLLGFATLVVAGTLVHFAPTVAGSRIRVRRSGGLAVGLLAIAAPLAAAGYALGPDPAGAAFPVAGWLVVVGAAAAVGGALALARHGLRAHADRAGWTTDSEWHRFTGRSLLLAPAWLLVATLLAAAGVLGHGADPQGWHLDRVGAPLVLGFVVQVLLGALSHLLPAIGPGTPEAHAVQRRVLGRGGTVRLGGWNAGVALLTVGLVAGRDALGSVGAPSFGAEMVAFGGLAIAVASGASTVLLLVTGLRAR